MLFSLVMAAFCVMLLFFMPFFLWRAFLKGYNIRAREDGKAEITDKRIFHTKKGVSSKESAEVVRNNTILENINNYDGTARGQKEVHSL